MAERPYKIIEFTGKLKGKKSVELVPSDWIEYDRDMQDLVTKFMPTPYTKDSVASLDEHVRLLKPAPDEWPKFPIAIIGDAKTFDDAVARLKKVETERFGFSTDCDDHGQMKSLAAKKSYQFKNTLNRDKDLSELLQVPLLKDDQAPSSSSSDLSENEQRIDNESTNGRRIQRNKIPQNKKQSCSKGIKSKSTAAKSAVLKINKQRDNNQSESPSEGQSVESLSIQGKDLLSKTNDQYEALVTAARSHSTQLTQMQLTLTVIQNVVEKLIDAQNQGQGLTQLSLAVVESFAAKHDIVLPITAIADFEKFDEVLTQNDCAQLKRDIWPLIEAKSNLSRSVSNVLKKYLSRNVMIEFTAVKKSPGKMVFKTTCFCGIVKDTIMAEYNKQPTRSPINDKKFHDALGTVINNAKDWEEHRFLRKKKPVIDDVVGDKRLGTDIEAN